MQTPAQTAMQPLAMPEITANLHTTFTEDLVADWRALVTKGQHAQPFYQPEWFLAFARSFGAGFDTYTITVREGARLVAILPLMRKGSFFGGVPARVLSSLSGIHSCRFDFITEQADHQEVVAVALGAIASDRTWDVVEVLDVPQHGSFERLVRGAQREGFLVGSWPTRKSPVLRIPAIGSDPYQNCPANFRSFRKRLSKKLDKLRLRGEVSFRVETAAYEDALARFLLLESSGWKGKNRSAIASNAQSAGFYSSVVESLHQRGQLRLYSLCLDGKPISMHLGLMMEGIYYSPKVAYDEDFSYFAPGHLLVQHIIGDLAANGGHTFEFLGPRAPWKQVWAHECVEHSNWYIFRSTIRGRCLHALTMRLAPRLKSLRHRVQGDPQSVSFSR
jgi:CelD/BcsL family acetyltransferase involved in cellulose biosynthesis